MDNVVPLQQRQERSRTAHRQHRALICLNFFTGLIEANVLLNLHSLSLNSQSRFTQNEAETTILRDKH